MKIQEQEEKIFTELKQLNPAVVTDGVVNEDEYKKAPFKILYILKEVNGGKSWDLRSFLKNGGRKQTWDNITRWTQGIFRINEELTWVTIETVQEEERKSYLNKIAAINLKKTSGSYVSKYKEIEQAAIGNKDLIMKQVRLIDPDIIVCCGTGWLFVEHIFRENSLECSKRLVE